MMTTDGHDVDIDGAHYASCPGCKKEEAEALPAVQTIKRKDTPDSRAHWEYAERISEQVQSEIFIDRAANLVARYVSDLFNGDVSRGKSIKAVTVAALKEARRG